MNDMTQTALSPALDVAALKAQAGQLIQSLAVQHCAANARRYTWATRIGGVAGQNSLGFQVDPPPYEGKVIWAERPWTILKTGRNEFKAVHESILPQLPELGSTIRVEEWARRNFDGSRLDAPKEEKQTLPDGRIYTTKTFKIGDNRVALPIAEPVCQYLKDMVALIEGKRMPDGVRTISQFLVDAKAHDFTVIDPDALGAENIVAMPPAIHFVVETGKFSGSLVLSYDRVMDYYRLTIGEEEIKDVDFEQVGQILADRLDDGQWMLAKVDVLKPAPRKRSAPTP